jgi:DNA primase
MNIDPSTTKYLIEAKIQAEGVVEKPDVVGAIFGQTEGLLGDELDLRDLQKSGRIGRIEVEISSGRGKSTGTVYVPSSLDQVETSILASALETIDRVGPCKARINVEKVEDVRMAKRSKIVERAKELLATMMNQARGTGLDLTESVRQAVQVEEITTFGPEKLPAGPNVEAADAIIVVEGRSDVLNLLKAGVKNAVAVEGTSVPKSVKELSKEKVVTAFVDGDRGGDLILKELAQVAEVDFIAKAPRGKEVEELSQKQIVKALRSKTPAEQYMEAHGLAAEKEAPASRRRRPSRPPRRKPQAPAEAPAPAPAPELSPDMEEYRDILVDLSGSSKARLIDTEGKTTQEVTVRDLANSLKANKVALKAVVFDGIITQRILDIAKEANMVAVVGTRMGTVESPPEGLSVWTSGDFNL